MMQAAGTARLLPFELTETTDAMDDERREERRSVLPERRVNEWTKPSVVIGVFGLFFQAFSIFIIVGGGLLAAYVASKSKDVSSDMTNAQVAGEIQKLSLKMDAISNMVQQANNTNTTQEGAINTLTRDMAEIKSNLADLTKTVENNEKAQRDYNFKLGNDMAAIKAGSNR